MELFIELSVILSITVIISYILRLLKQPLVLGYIVSGILIGPAVLNLFHSNEAVEVLSKIGITILLFIIGMELSPQNIKETGKVSVFVGIVQVLFTGIAGFFILRWLDFSIISSIIMSIALSFSSTVIILKLLGDKGDMHKLYAKMSIGVLLVQDIAATFALIIIAGLGAASASGGLISLFISLFLKGFGLAVILYITTKYLLPKIL